MALATYADLLTSVGTWLGRVDLTASDDDFVILAEAAFNRTLFTEDSVSAETSVTAASDGTFALPATFRRMRIIRNTETYPKPLDQVPDSVGVTLTGSVPLAYSIDGANVQLWPKAAHSVVYKYYATIPALSAGVNWLYTKHPDIYLLGCLVAAEAFILNDPRIPVWKSQLQESIDQLNGANDKKRWNETRLRISAGRGY